MRLSLLTSWRHSPTLFLAGANTVCGVVFQFGILWRLGIGTRSDLYFASIVAPMVLYTLAFGSLSNILIPMLVECRATDFAESTFLWNTMLAILVGGSLLLILSYYPLLYLFPLMFRKLAWIDLGQVSKVVLAYSAYQILFSAATVKNCFLVAEERPVSAQIGTLGGWLFSLVLLASIHSNQRLWRIPLWLVCGNAVTLLWPNLRRNLFTYRRGLFRLHLISLLHRCLPVLAGGAVTKLEPVLDGVIASFFKEGSLTIFYFFGRAMFYVSSIIFSGYIQPEQKHLADAVNAGQWETVGNKTRLLSLRAMFISVGMLAAATALCAVLYLCGFHSLKRYIGYLSADLSVFFLLLGYLFGLIAGVCYANSLYVIRRERAFLFATIATFPVGIVCKLAGANMLGLPGLAAGTSVYWILYAVSLAFVFSRSLSREAQTADKERSYEPAAISQ